MPWQCMVYAVPKGWYNPGIPGMAQNYWHPNMDNYFTSCDPHHDIYTFSYWQIFWHIFYPDITAWHWLFFWWQMSSGFFNKSNLGSSGSLQKKARQGTSSRKFCHTASWPMHAPSSSPQLFEDAEICWKNMKPPAPPGGVTWCSNLLVFKPPSTICISYI